MFQSNDGPASPFFTPIRLKGNGSLQDLQQKSISPQMAVRSNMPCWPYRILGIPFDIGEILFLADQSLAVPFNPLKALAGFYAHG
jgi:hypothetical protein